MSAILYARVSTGAQAEKELSIPAQLRAMRARAATEGWHVAAEYTDVRSGRSFEDRPGLVEAIHHSRRDEDVTVLLVHRVDRVARNVADHITIRGRLKSRGVRLASVVETLEASPMGEFIELIMAAHAEYYSANLSLEVKKGLDERKLKGRWTGKAPTGYLTENGRVVLDPARAPLVTRAFERWITGAVTADQLADELREAGFVGQEGNPIGKSVLCRLLKNPFYVGDMMIKGETYPGRHRPIISRSTFAKAQDVFRARRTSSRRRRKHTFLLTRLIRCPSCDSSVVGETHTKKSGKVYRYYRCTRRNCSITWRMNDINDKVIALLRAAKLETRVLPTLRRTARAQRNGNQGERIKELRASIRKVGRDLRTLAKAYVERRRDEDSYDFEREGLLLLKRHHEYELAVACGRIHGESCDDASALIHSIKTLDTVLREGSDVEKHTCVSKLISSVSLRDGVEITWSPVLEACKGFKKPLPLPDAG